MQIKVKLIIFKLFEKHVLGDIDQLYAEANQTLVAAGILPELQSAPPRRQQRPGGPAASHTSPATHSQPVHVDEGLQEAAFSALHNLLSDLRGSSVLPARNVPSDAIPISSGDLLRLLSHMQTRAPQTVDDFDLQEQLGSLLSRVSAKTGKSRVVGEIDDDVINLVSMLFEFILDDRTLPDSLKALIGRLQIPLLKVAVIDKTFFSRGSHPARRLLNEIASAAMGWGDQDEAQRDSLYQKIEQIVARLLNDFVDDPAIFSELLADFLAFIGDERRRSELLEQRTRDAEEGRAKAEIARQEVEYALNQRLLGKTLPEVVVRLLQEAWSKVLLLTCLKHGTQSEEWQAALDTMDDLVWSVTPTKTTNPARACWSWSRACSRHCVRAWSAPRSTPSPPATFSPSSKHCTYRPCSAFSNRKPLQAHPDRPLTRQASRSPLQRSRLRRPWSRWWTRSCCWHPARAASPSRKSACRTTTKR